jgi:hypothetical protein
MSPAGCLRIKKLSEIKRFTDALCSKMGATRKEIQLGISKNFEPKKTVKNYEQVHFKYFLRTEPLS